MKVAELIKRDFPGLAASPELLQEIANDLNTSIDQIIYTWILYHPARVIPIIGSGKIERLKKDISYQKNILNKTL